MGMILVTIGLCILSLFAIGTLCWGVFVAWEQSPLMGIVLGTLFLATFTTIGGLVLMHFSGA